jgi:hypothetical protein
MRRQNGLETACRAPLLVDVAEPFALLAILEQAGHGHNQDGLDSDHAKDGGENVVNKLVSKANQRAGTATLQGRCSGTRTCRIRNEGWRCAVIVPTAFKL